MLQAAPKPALAALLFLALVAAGCGREAPARSEQRFADWADFAVRGARPRERPRVIMVGLDGASWDYIDPLTRAGKLPNLARLRREGAWGRLRSVDCYFTPPAWTAMLTGRLPEHTGVYSFGTWDPAARAFRTVSARDVGVPAVWDVASAAGLRVASIGVPITYPARPINGVMVGGLETPKNHGPRLEFVPAQGRFPPPGAAPKSFAPALSAALEDAHNVLFLVFLDSQDDGQTRYDRVWLRVVAKGPGAPETRMLGSYEFPLGEFSPWVRVRAERDGPLDDAFLKLQFLAPHGDFGFRASPAFFRLDQPFTYPPGLAAQLEQRFGYYLPHEFLSIELTPFAARDSAAAARWFLAQEPWDLFLTVFGESDNAHHLVGFADSALPVYETIDAFLGEVMQQLDARTTLVVTSDHGFGPYELTIDLNRWLAEQGLLRWRRPGVIDHDASVVFHQMWHLYFDPRLLSQDELTRRGVQVRPGETPRQALIRHLADAAQHIRGGDGRELPVVLAPLPDGAAGHAPDMEVKGHPKGVWVEFWNLQHPSDSVVSRLTDADRWKHARDGIVAFYGARIEPGELGTLPIQDVAPTLLDLLGLPVADDLDGHVIPGIRRGADAALPLLRVAHYPERAPVPEAQGAADAEFEATLKALGYVRD
jgi:predicted AlkP superfamily phosphohydrolase/phosphomutase